MWVAASTPVCEAVRCLGLGRTRLTEVVDSTTQQRQALQSILVGVLLVFDSGEPVAAHVERRTL